MFNELFPIVNEAGTLIIRLQVDKQDPTKLQAFVTPQHPNGEKYPALNQTIMLSNTPSGLDEDFASVYKGYIPEYVAASAAIRDSVAQLAANTEAAKKAVTKVQAKADTPKSVAGAAKPAPKPAPAPEPQVSLFSNLEQLESGEEQIPADREVEKEEATATASTASTDTVPPRTGEIIQPSVFDTSPPVAHSTSVMMQQGALLEASVPAPPPAPIPAEAPPAALFATI